MRDRKHILCFRFFKIWDKLEKEKEKEKEIEKEKGEGRIYVWKKEYLEP